VIPGMGLLGNREPLECAARPLAAPPRDGASSVADEWEGWESRRHSRDEQGLVVGIMKPSRVGCGAEQRMRLTLNRCCRS
jgi:hypothetical protein